jgi:hypothetical protein
MKNIDITRKGAKMIITENREKVKRKALSLINKGDKDLSKPEKKFMLEMMMGMVLTGSSNLTQIARSLKEPIKVKDTLKRLGRMSSKEHILDTANEISLKEAKSRINSKTVLALDSGDIVHQYGRKFENMEQVLDGSSNNIERGYWLNQITGYNPSTHETFPVLLDMYSVKAPGFKSSNIESINLVEKVRKAKGNEGLWVMDRGYDRGEIFDYFLSKKLDFIIRMQITRNLILKSQPHNIKKIAHGINRRINFSSNSRFGSKKVLFKIKGVKYQVTLICFKDKRNKEPIIWLVNGWIKSAKELKRRIRGYFKRWSIEESYRFEKQGFGIEKATVRRYCKIKNLVGITILSWLLLVKINDVPRLKETVLKRAKMEKIKRKHRPKFIYYRLLKGVQNLFEGAKELFRYRLKRRQKNKIRREMGLKNSLFPDFQWKTMGMEI